MNRGQEAEHTGPSPEGASTSRVPPTGSAQDCSSVVRPWRFLSAPVLPLKQTPELNCAKENQGKRLSFVSEDSRLREKRAQGPQVCHRVAGRGGAFSLELPDSFQGLPLPSNYQLTQECLRTAPLGPVCHLLLAWPTARGDRKPPPQSWLP